MNSWQTISAAIFANATLLAVLGWIGKSLFEHVIDRNSQRFEIELRAKADSTIERLKTDLQLKTIEHQVRFSRLHEKQAGVIAELNAHIVEALWAAESFLSPMEWVGEPKKPEKHRNAMNKLVELYRYFEKHRIYLPDQLCAVVEKLITDVRSHVIRFGVYIDWDNVALPAHAQEEKHTAWMSGWEAIKTQVPNVQKTLENEFRVLLGQQV
jgi:hypothetical protein